MFIAMNQFQVDPARGEEFEEVWRNRESFLQGFTGFVHFALLKGDDPGDYVSHSTWASRAPTFSRGRNPMPSGTRTA